MNKPAILLNSLILSAVLLLSSCQPAAPPAGGQKSIVVTYSILGSLVKELVGDQASVTVSIPNGLDPHEWEPSARDIEIINKADLVIENGLGIEGGMGKALEGARQKYNRFFTASDYITIRTVGAGEGIPARDAEGLAGMPDPHFWLDPLAMKPIVIALTKMLGNDFNIDVNERAKDIAGRLDALDAEIKGMAAAVPVENRKLVTGHESMGYFAARYDFKLIGVIIPGLTTQADVSAADLAALKKAIATNDVKAVFTELGTPAAVANVIGRETGVKVIPLSTHLLPPDGSYFTFMRNLAIVVTAALL
jgi:zinc/manganese transport system substrate-binding protein